MSFKNYLKTLTLVTSCIMLTSCKTILGEYVNESVDNAGNTVIKKLNLKIDNTCSFSTTTYLPDETTTVKTEPKCSWQRYENATYSKLIRVAMPQNTTPVYISELFCIIEGENLIDRSDSTAIYYKK